ncbi:TetR/AcrR family transcriptional regulator [Paenacidovorax monticola]|uniref:TetR/AcrR family transcriptional regulator n=1 Tax=Paenacidovorax monticola TaxID=1926868 RepID=A0A7H0HJV0_9BURK|nr:TetR/AcrR family transcriptional regulator [Paenacidovorax monticola]MBO9677884.1 TetR/AcrR family transcriptional regulator [Acidovorax sp.]QNP60816.1 TetR/AcrR family transcriptional regulator [Paenacidovorax monticola]
MSPKRPDAATRRAQLLDAADAVFRVHGVGAPLDLIVEQAGVGRATLYRQFADRHAILQALMERSVERLQQQVERLSARDDAFLLLLQYLADRIVDSPALSDYWRTASARDPRFLPLRRQVWRAFAPSLARAQACGLVRDDLQPGDISLLSGMLGAALRGETDAERRRLVQRALDIIHRGLRPATPA